MLDTMTMTKVIGGLCGTFLLYLLGAWAAESIYHVGGGHGGEGEHGFLVEQAYTIPVEGISGAESNEMAEEVDFDMLLASADAGKGERVFQKCAACHSLEAGENKVGPSLHGVVGRPVDSIAGFEYSGALEKVVDVWTPENLNHFLTKPGAFAPGTEMSFNGLPKIEDRANVVAYLQSVGG